MPAFPSEFGVELGAEIELNSLWPVEATERMNRMYRRQRHIYDGTRRFYLLGRDQLIENLRPEAGASVLEIGCGTGRNLVQTARRFPGAKLFGIDVSTEMLTSAIASISRRGLSSRIWVAHGDATGFDPQLLFGVPAFDHVMISYSLSMIPAWNRVIESGASPPQARRPFAHRRFRSAGAAAQDRACAAVAMARPVRCDAARGSRARAVGNRKQPRGADLKFERPFRGYAQYAVLTLRSGPARP